MKVSKYAENMWHFIKQNFRKQCVSCHFDYWLLKDKILWLSWDKACKNFPNLPNLIKMLRLLWLVLPAVSLPLSRVHPVKTNWWRGGNIPLTISIWEVCIYFWEQLLRPTHAWFPWSVWRHLFPRDLCIHASWVIFICHVVTPRSSVWFPETRFALWKWATWWEKQQKYSCAWLCQHESVQFSVWHYNSASGRTHRLDIDLITSAYNRTQPTFSVLHTASAWGLLTYFTFSNSLSSWLVLEFLCS